MTFLTRCNLVPTIGQEVRVTRVLCDFSKVDDVEDIDW